MARTRTDAQAAFVLHTYPFRETSLIIDVFTRDFGRLPLVARGARRPRSVLRGLLLAFQPLEISWAGKGEIKTLMKAEWQGGQPLLTGRALFCGYYLNELLLALLPREDAHEALFLAYAQTLQRFSDALKESDLRRFEQVFLRELGYGLTLEHDEQGKPIEAADFYRYEVETGPVLQHGNGEDSPINAPFLIRGQTLLDLAQGDFSKASTLSEAKLLMRTLIRHYTGEKGLESRKIFMELHEL